MSQSIERRARRGRRLAEWPWLVVVPYWVGLVTLGLAACAEEDSPEQDVGTSTPAAGGSKGLDSGDEAPTPIGTAIAATVETEPVAGAGDAADDPAIWVHPTDPAKSVLLGTDKSVGGGIYVYDLAGKILQFTEIGEVNNVDLRQGFELGGKEVTLVTGVNRTNNTLVIYALDTDTRGLTNVAAREVTVTPGGYGSCMYKNAEGNTFAFVDSTAGIIEQYRLFADGDKVDAEVVRTLCVPSQPEACVADDELGSLFVGEEAIGIWKFPADIDGAATGETVPECDGAEAGALIDDTTDGHLTADVEGLAIAVTGPGEGYLFASSQGADEFVVYDRKAPHAHVLTFNVWGGGDACIDGVEGSDGIDVTGAALGDAFPHGLFVTQDGSNGDPAANQNFKLVPLDAILEQRVVEAASECKLSDFGGKARQSDVPAGPEHDAAFCDAFCGRCDECYASGVEGFAEGDCHYESPKPTFDLDDCLAGCNAGIVPADTSPLQSGWEAWECLALDDAL